MGFFQNLLGVTPDNSVNKVDTSYPQNAREMIDRLNAAKDELKRHKQRYFPELLDQPKRNYIPYQMLADKFEVFENYLVSTVPSARWSCLISFTGCPKMLATEFL